MSTMQDTSRLLEARYIQHDLKGPEHLGSRTKEQNDKRNFYFNTAALDTK